MDIGVDSQLNHTQSIMPARDRNSYVRHKPVLIILHQKHSTPGRIGHWFIDNGVPLDIRRPRFGSQLPKTLDDHCGAVIFGGPMSANDSDDYVREETNWIDIPLKENKPFFGVCLGAQMLARFLGARVTCHPQANIEVGYYPIKPTEAGQDAYAWPKSFYQWHTEGFELPYDATLLAASDEFENQAFTYGSALGVQFHPEITYALVNRWTSSRPDRLATKGAQPRKSHFEGHFTHARDVGYWLDGYLKTWLTAGQ